jgi:hypothetical protein
MKVKKAVAIGVGEARILALDTSKFSKLLYQQNKPDPYTTPIAIKKKLFIGLRKKLRFSSGKKMKYVENNMIPLIKFLTKTI